MPYATRYITTGCTCIGEGAMGYSACLLDNGCAFARLGTELEGKSRLVSLEVTNQESLLLDRHAV